MEGFLLQLNRVKCLAPGVTFTMASYILTPLDIRTDNIDLVPVSVTCPPLVLVFSSASVSF